MPTTRSRSKNASAAAPDLVWVWDGALVAAARSGTASRLHPGKHMTQGEVAAVMGVGDECVRRWEVAFDARRQGLTGSTPTVGDLGRLATLLGKTPGAFFRQVPAAHAA